MYNIKSFRTLFINITTQGRLNKV